MIQSGPVAFCGWLETKDCRPYRTDVQLYKSLLFLKRSIDRDLIVSAQREALQTLRCIISNLEYRLSLIHISSDGFPFLIRCSIIR